MPKPALCVFLAVTVLLAASKAVGQAVPPVGGKPKLVTVTVTGMGMDKEQAKRDAMRKAVEKAGGAYIYSQSKTKDFALIRDTVLARAAGFIESHEVISSKQTADGVWEVQVRAIVSTRKISDMWGVVRNFLTQMGRPKIMVFISEKIDSRRQDDSTVQSRIENLLLKSGFLLVNKNQIKEIQRKDLEAAVAEDNPAKMQAIAKAFGAQLFISGSTNATLTSSRPVYGVEMHRYGAEGDLKCYRSDTAQLMASRNASGFSADRTKRVAAKKGLAAFGDKIAPLIRADILRFWQDVLQGRGELVLAVEGISFKQYIALKKAIGEVKEVKDVSATFSNRIAKCSIQSDVRAEVLAEKLVEKIEDLEINDVSQNVIKANWTD